MPFRKGQWTGSPWSHEMGPKEWPKGWGSGRRSLFLRFAGMFGFMVVLLLGGMAALAFLITQLFGGDGKTTVLVWIGGVGLVFAMPILAVALAVRAFRGIAMPLADVMTAADTVAEGDLTVRVDEHGPGEFSRLARSFNRMTEELERTDRQRRNLTADVAHELRTPLHIIQGNLEGVLDGVYDPTDEHINTTLDETRLLGRLVEDLRTLSLAESGELPLRREDVDVAELLADVGTTFSGHAEADDIELRVETGPSGATIHADAGRMNQVLGNLVVNALRHTASGGSVALRSEATPDGVRISVGDTGEGIAADDLPFIFDRFWRADRSRSRGDGVGSGLGLPIARQLVQNQGGRIEVESEQGVGTTFTIVLPASDGPSV